MGSNPGYLLKSFLLYNLPLLQIYKIETAPEYTIINLKPPNTHTHCAKFICPFDPSPEPQIE